MNNTIDRLKAISPDIESVTTYTYMPGINGWAVRLRYKNDKHTEFSVDMGTASDDEMRGIVQKAIVKQLEYHEQMKAEGKSNA